MEKMTTMRDLNASCVASSAAHLAPGQARVAALAALIRELSTAARTLTRKATAGGSVSHGMVV